MILGQNIDTTTAHFLPKYVKITSRRSCQDGFPVYEMQNVSVEKLNVSAQ